MLTQSYEFPDFNINYPKDWTVATSTGANNASVVQFVSPRQGALDPLQELAGVSVFPNATQSQATAVMSYLKNGLLNNADARFKKTPATGSIHGIQIAEGVIEDASLQNYPVPVLDYVVFFSRGSTLYVLDNIIQDGADASSFYNLLGTMVGSLTPR